MKNSEIEKIKKNCITNGVYHSSTRKRYHPLPTSSVMIGQSRPVLDIEKNNSNYFAVEY